MRIKLWKEILQMASDKLTFRPRPRSKGSESTPIDTELPGKEDQLSTLLSEERDILEIEFKELSNHIDKMQGQLKRTQKRLKLVEELLRTYSDSSGKE